MIDFEFNCPGKVFIFGEYACLNGGPALVGTLEPCFKLKIQGKELGVTSNDTRPEYSKHLSHDEYLSHDRLDLTFPFHPESPAGIFLTKNLVAIQEYELEWHDPYDTPIGVGSSSAQFILTVAALAKLNKEPLPTVSKVLEMYWETVGTSQGLRPSGVDVVAQWIGGPCVVQASDTGLTTDSLIPFASHDTEFILAYTGSKLKTHEHLMNLHERGFPKAFAKMIERLNAITQTGLKAWRETNPYDLGLALWEYQVTLTEAGIAPKDLTAKLEELLRSPGVLGCKGSGAQGGDCILLLIQKQQLARVSQEIKNLGWQPLPIAWTMSGFIK